MPIKKKKISELNEAGDLTGFFTIGYRVINGVKESVKYGLQKIQDLYENLIKAIRDAGEATADMRELETTVETNENTRSAAESERNASEQVRLAAELSRAGAESSRVTAEDSRSVAETGRVTAETARSAAETSRASAENSRAQAESARAVSEAARVEAEAIRVTEFATIKQNAETATSNANTATENAYAAAEAADTAREAATEVAGHPTYVGTDNYVYTWNAVTKSYDRTNIYVKGEAFNISKVYDSVSALEADADNADIKEGAFVLVNTNDVENPDNARLYVKVKNPDDTYRYNFLVDMSGAIGFTGKTPQFTKGTITTGEAGTDVQLSLSESGTDPDGNPVVALNLVIPRGNPGVPFKVLGHYDTLDALKAAVPDGTDAEGVYAVGTELPYEYYAWARDSRVGVHDDFNSETWAFPSIDEGADAVESTHAKDVIHIINASDNIKYAFAKLVQPGETFKTSLKITGLLPLNYTLEEVMNTSNALTDLTGFGLITLINSFSPEKIMDHIDKDGVHSFEYTNTGGAAEAFMFMYLGQPGSCDITIELIQEPLTGWINQGRLQGTDGKSAYQVACDNGYAGTEAEWLASLKGEKGDTTEFDELYFVKAEDKVSLKNNITFQGDVAVTGAIHSEQAYLVADKGWFQCSTMNTGLYNHAADTRIFAVEPKVWGCDSNLRLLSGSSYQFANGTTKLSLGENESVNIATKYGDVSIGPINTEYCHFGTERPRFYMDKPLHVDGEIYSGSGYHNLVLNTQNSATYWSMCEKIPGRYHELDLTGLDESLYYPCTCHVSSAALTRIQVTSVLTDKSYPSWGTHSSGFAFDLILEVSGPGYGTLSYCSRVLKAEYAWATGTPCAGYTVAWQSNQFIVWLRGGGVYDVYKDNNTPMTIHGNYNDGYTIYGAYNYNQATARWGNIWTSGAGILGVGSLIASGYITAVGEITANSTSDERLKKDIVDFSEEEATKIVMNTRPVSYRWNDKAFELNPHRSKKRECGLIAQELEPYLPCAIKPVWDEYKAIDYTRLIAPMLSVMKKQEREIEELRKEVQQLKKELE